MIGWLLAVLMIALLVWWPTLNLVLAAFSWRTPVSATEHREREPFSFFIVIPALNEERVIESTVRDALALDTPETPVRVLVVDDDSDDRTRAVLADIPDPRLHVIHRRPPRARRGKGDSLNQACQHVLNRAELDPARTVVGVIDGDGRGSPGMLGEVASVLRDDTVGAVQCGIRVHNRTGVLPLLQDLEFGAVMDSSQLLRDLLGSVGLGGNGQFVRLSVLADLAPDIWTDCLVEDYELALRLHLAGVRVRYTSRARVSQQGLPDVRRLLRQRARWAQGNLQCVRHVPALVKSRSVGNPALLDFLVALLSPWATVPVSAIFSGLIAFSVADTAAASGDVVTAAPAIALASATWLLLLFLPGLVWALVHRLRLGDEPLWRCLLAGLCYPFFLLFGVISTWRALFRRLARRSSWAKTDRVPDRPAVAD
ncbi:Glycosyltransferase, catalytic subunit of cellulose synthase and poly-beta-1,6-N-acetylglucosamine synthase [Actinopolyspora xinjiangensis]|uniref:Glycosyltransferase, catalytic subunit of cellulose synthase and poly-beta-1,6-N-acetylglucosamine synthase n=1 Tax=Actinopolyspora xinjiangensis TaxID=405564 RepID=A0A1H0W0T3_9ACTN|nr:glycosyltransferase [Actinopolyspora xinjiangensis]SDP84292.1 Glycosyltransferase, catalytic subunit of cellulose synthase and poly-beta-1,6-N-acetylglucosamine synthase [Actinopolyspora xinjiangensis]